MLPEGMILEPIRERRAERRVYYRPDGYPTLPLRADGLFLQHYLSKGFALKSPEGKVKGIRCPLCDFVTESAFGLQSHLRKHINESKKEVK